MFEQMVSEGTKNSVWRLKFGFFYWNEMYLGSVTRTKEMTWIYFGKDSQGQHFWLLKVENNVLYFMAKYV
jgi:hypothetical protein